VTSSTSASAACKKTIANASFPAVERQQGVCVRVEQAGPRSLPVRGRVRVAEWTGRSAPARADRGRRRAPGGDDAHLVGLVAGELGRLGPAPPARAPVPGRPKGRVSQSAISGSSGDLLPILRAARSSAMGLRPVTALVGRDFRRLPARPAIRLERAPRGRAPWLRGSLGVFVDQVPCRGPKWRATASAVWRSNVLSSRRISGASCFRLDLRAESAVHCGPLRFAPCWGCALRARPGPEAEAWAP